MPVILLALALSESVLAATETKDYRLVVEPQADSSASRRWTPGVDSWKRQGDQDCPAFFQDDMEGFGVLRVGPRCVEDEVPYSRPGTVQR